MSGEIEKEVVLINKGKLKIFFGYAAGVGKTYAMLSEAHLQIEKGVKVMVGYIEPHTRPDTIALLSGLAAMPQKKINYKDIILSEFDIDTALVLRPQLVLVDELAHTNAAGSRNKKRYQDIEELLNAGIDVYTTVNVQHLESLNDLVSDITKIKVNETVPDYIFDNADMIKLIDIEPNELLKRIEEGKIYKEESANAALKNFFVDDNLRLLREIAMRKVASKIGSQNSASENTIQSKFLLCMSTSPLSKRAIRWTARAADAFHSPWVAVYIQNVDNNELSDEQKKNLNQNMDLAKKLGGEVATLSGLNIAETIAEYAKIANITNIVIGKSLNKKTLINFYKPQLEDSLVLLLPNIEVHIISGDNGKSNYVSKRKVFRKIDFSFAELAKALCVLVGATLICYGLQQLKVGESNLVIVYVLSSLVTALVTKKYIYGIINSVLSVLTFNFFFTTPIFTFHTIDASYWITFVIMFVVSIVTSALITTIQKQKEHSLFREKKTNILFEINKNLLFADNEDEIINLGLSYIEKLFSSPTIFYTQHSSSGKIFSSSGDDGAYLSDKLESTVADWVFVNNKEAGCATDTLTSAKAIYVPCACHNTVLGVFGLSTINVSLSYEHISFLKTVSSLTAAALERQRLVSEQNKVLIDSEREKVRAGLLMAISHDLRTPLTGIYGASSAILENEKLDKKVSAQLLNNIKQESQWLIRMIENLLSVTKISENVGGLKKSDEAVEEVIAEAVTRVKKRYPNRVVDVHAPSELLIAPMDGLLIVQALINIIENALKFSDEKSPVDVNIFCKNASVVFEIKDSGVGIDKDDLPNLFEYATNKSSNADSKRGLGIGLLICKTIISAHGGTIQAINREEGGTVMQFSLPLKN